MVKIAIVDKYRVTVTIFPTIESMRQNSKIESMAVMDATTTKSLPEYSMVETISTKSLPEYSEIESMTVLTTKSLTDYSDVDLKRSVCSNCVTKNITLIITSNHHVWCLFYNMVSVNVHSFTLHLT